MTYRYRFLLAAAFMAALVATCPAQAQQAPVQGAGALEEFVVTGTRVANRSALDTAVPVDVVSAETLNNVGVTELNQALSTVLPSYNFPRPGLNDGTDTVRPATLRGLAPDQTLVLLNSKRRHAASLVNVNGSIGRGSSAVDLNTVPNAMVRSVEVLRDGASAQYGSDAIAGVINVRLREDSSGGAFTATYGQRDTGYTVPTGAVPSGATWTSPGSIASKRSDGDTTTVSGWKGFSFGDDGYLTIAAEYKDQAYTKRDGWDVRQQYPKLPSGAFDPRELTINRFNAWYGEPDLKQGTLFANFGSTLSDTTRLYGWASYQDRDAHSGGFFRRALDDRNVIEIYPDGFLPVIAPEVTDISAALGVEWRFGEWGMDTSVVYGKNKMQFTIEDTLNRSLGTASKTVFDSGGFFYDQYVFNLSGVRGYGVGGLASPINVAAGIEARQESYAIFAGEPDSYRNGGVLLPNGQPAVSGAQVFPGFRPSNEVDRKRTAIGAYIDIEARLTEKLLGSVAARIEDYSDFGGNLSGKLALRYDFNDSFALRGSVQNGFRAPSLQQQYFATTSTNFINGVPFDITTFPVTAPEAKAMGAHPLDAEESVNVSLGAVIRFDRAYITIDAYHIDITDRIVLSENLTSVAVRNYLQSMGFVGAGGGRFFINGVDTTTKGVDVVVTLPMQTESAGSFEVTLTGNFNDTGVTKVPKSNELSTLVPPPVLFDRINVLTFEEGTPQNKFGAAVNWTLDRVSATLRATRYGSALDPGTDASLDFELGAQTLVDLEFRFDPTDHVKLALGAENLFDGYPEAFPVSRNATGNTPFSNYSPFGRAGRFVYGRMSFHF